MQPQNTNILYRAYNKYKSNTNSNILGLLIYMRCTNNYILMMLKTYSITVYNPRIITH